MAITPTTLQLFRQIKAQQLSIATEAILQSTLQFYWYNEEKQLKALGSGVLLTIDNRFFVATAAHVIHQGHGNTFVLLGDYEVTLAGMWCATTPTVVDLAVLELSDAAQLAELQRAYRFLTLTDLSTRRRHLNDLYLIVGYPATKTKVYGGYSHAKPYPLQAQEASGFDFATHQLQPATHLVLDGTGLVVSASNPNPHRTPDLEGSSGGGVWHNGNYLKGDPAREKRLVGLLTQEVYEGRGPGRRRSLLVTRTAVLLEFMRQAFGLSIPAPNTRKSKATPVV